MATPKIVIGLGISYNKDVNNWHNGTNSFLKSYLKTFCMVLHGQYSYWTAKYIVYGRPLSRVFFKRTNFFIQISLKRTFEWDESKMSSNLFFNNSSAWSLCNVHKKRAELWQKTLPHFNLLTMHCKQWVDIIFDTGFFNWIWLYLKTYAVWKQRCLKIRNLLQN